jgi:hypothetical protein
MITSCEQSRRVQKARRDAGLRGRSKAVRRWFQRQYGCAIDAHSGDLWYSWWMQGANMHDDEVEMRDDLKYALRGDFTGCGKFQEKCL